MGFIAGTSEDEPALVTARAVHQVEKAHWINTFSVQTVARTPRWGVRDAAPDAGLHRGAVASTLISS